MHSSRTLSATQTPSSIPGEQKTLKLSRKMIHGNTSCRWLPWGRSASSGLKNETENAPSPTRGTRPFAPYIKNKWQVSHQLISGIPRGVYDSSQHHCVNITEYSYTNYNDHEVPGETFTGNHCLLCGPQLTTSLWFSS